MNASLAQPAQSVGGVVMMCFGPRSSQRTLDKVEDVCYHFDSTHHRRDSAMPQLLVRDLDTGTVERLKLRAQRHGRSLQGEVKAILQAAATVSMSEANSIAEGWQRKLAGGAYSDSAEAIREDRER